MWQDIREPKIKILDHMILAEGKALAVLSHLVEGCSVRSTERLTGVHRDTILDLLNVAGRKCEALMRGRGQRFHMMTAELPYSAVDERL